MRSFDRNLNQKKNKNYCPIFYNTRNTPNEETGFQVFPMAPRQQSALRPLSDLTNLTISPSSLRSCSSIGSSMPQIHDAVVQSQDRRKGKAVMVEYVHSTQATRKLKQINKRKLKKANQYARNPVLSPRDVEKESSVKVIPPLDYIEKQRAYFAEIDAFELVEEEVSESELE